MNRSSQAVLAALFGAVVSFALTAATPSVNWPWGVESDAVAAAPDSHRVLLENESVRVLEVVISPGKREPAHTHSLPSVMMVLEPARIRYYDAKGELRFETPDNRELGSALLDADWMLPEGLHAVENIDRKAFRALRVELKGEGEAGPS